MEHKQPQWTKDRNSARNSGNRINQPWCWKARVIAQGSDPGFVALQVIVKSCSTVPMKTGTDS